MIRVIDEAGVLSPDEKRQLSTFIIHKCRSTIKDTGWLRHIRVRSDDRSGYLGYWACHLIRDGAHIQHFESVIILNSWYLKTIESMEETLAHEYGHNWTLGHLLLLERLQDENDIFACRAPWLYYRIRRMNPKQFSSNITKGWEYCDKEVLAEDYRCLFTKSKEPHYIVKLVGNPSTEVKDYIKNFSTDVRHYH